MPQKVKGLLAILFEEFPAVVANRCCQLREFPEVGAGLDLMGDRILPFFQVPVRDKLSAFVAPVYKHHVSPGFHSLNQILADFEQLGDRPYGDAELFRGLDAAKQWCHGFILLA